MELGLLLHLNGAPHTGNLWSFLSQRDYYSEFCIKRVTLASVLRLALEGEGRHRDEKRVIAFIQARHDLFRSRK